MTVPSESTLRSRCRTRRLSLCKLRFGSRWHGQYGPHMLIDAHNNTLLAWELDLNDVARELRDEHPGYEDP